MRWEGGGGRVGVMKSTGCCRWETLRRMSEVRCVQMAGKEVGGELAVGNQANEAKRCGEIWDTSSGNRAGGMRCDAMRMRQRDKTRRDDGATTTK